MTLFPQHRLLRRLALLWLAVSAMVLVAMLMRPELDMDQRRAFSTHFIVIVPTLNMPANSTMSTTRGFMPRR